MKNELVNVVNGKAVCTSLMVAEKFGKEHFNVLRDIENLECSQEFRAINYELSSYKSKQGKQIPMIQMTRDGFSVLVMGFTGKEAMAWKEKYIAAFNAMEDELIKRQKPMTAMQMLEAQLVIMKEQEEKMLRLEAEQRGLADKQMETDIKLNLIEAKVTTSNSDYYSVSGYASLKGHRHLDVRRANLIGRLAAKLSREYDIEVGKVKDERYGQVNTYHIDILNEAFNRRI